MSDVEGRADDYERRAGDGTDIIGGLVRGFKHQQRIVKWLAISLVVDIILSVVVGVLAFNVNVNSQNIADVQNRTSSEVLCPLYALLLHAVQHPVAERVATPADRALNRHQLKVITEGYNILGCGNRSG